MRIAVVGTGYVGLVTGTCFAETGNKVICIDIDNNKVEAMQTGKVPIYEPNLDSLFRRNIDEKRLSFTTSLNEGLENADVVFLALPTPPSEDGSADLSHILSVSENIGPLLTKYTLIVNKSTVPVGTASMVRQIIKSKTKVLFDVISNPEFLREGFAVSDFMKPDRIVIGTRSIKAKKIMKDLYGPFVRQGNPIIFMDEKSAEMTKYAANSFLATKISFMNEVANLAEKVGADIDAIRLGIGADERIGKRFLFAGIGYGGSCFPKDVLALSSIGARYGYDLKILNAVMSVNDDQKHRLSQKILSYYKGNIVNKKFAIWGLSFKPDTDDMREAPSLTIINDLQAKGAKIVAYDPEAMDNAKKIYADNKSVKFAGDAYKALNGADALIIATEWSEFRSPDFGRMKLSLKQPLIFDGRNLYDTERMRIEGFRYESIGRKAVDV